jgi:hypothetical protein
MFYGFIMVNDEHYLEVNLKNVLHTILSLFYFSSAIGPSGWK